MFSQQSYFTVTKWFLRKQVQLTMAEMKGNKSIATGIVREQRSLVSNKRLHDKFKAF